MTEDQEKEWEKLVGDILDENMGPPINEYWCAAVVNRSFEAGVDSERKQHDMPCTECKEKAKPVVWACSCGNQLTRGMHVRVQELVEALEQVADKKTDTSGAHSMRAITTAQQALDKWNVGTSGRME